MNFNNFDDEIYKTISLLFSFARAQQRRSNKTTPINTWVKIHHAGVRRGTGGMCSVSFLANVKVSHRYPFRTFADNVHHTYTWTKHIINTHTIWYSCLSAPDEHSQENLCDTLFLCVCISNVCVCESSVYALTIISFEYITLNSNRRSDPVCAITLPLQPSARYLFASQKERTAHTILFLCRFAAQLALRVDIPFPIKVTTPKSPTHV